MMEERDGSKNLEMEGGMVKKRVKKSWDESKTMWEIAAPATLTSVAQMSIGFVSCAFVGHLGEVELASVSIVQNVIEGFVFGVMLGMGSALETLCGQAVGAGKFNMLGIYLQRSWIITGVTSLVLLPFYAFASPLLQLLHQDKAISKLAGKYSIWVIPQLFAYAMNFPIQKFLQAQSKVWVMTIMSVITLLVHVLLNWVFVTKMEKGLLGAAIAGNISWWLLILCQCFYVMYGFFPEAWSGFSYSAFRSLSGFVKLSISSALMLCLDLWYFTIVILMVGWLKNPKIAVDAISICMNLQVWTLMISMGFNAAVSVRVSNELGAGNSKAAKFSVVVTVLTSAIIGTVFTVAIIASKNQFPRIFSDKPLVIKEASKLGYFTAATIFLNGILPVLQGAAVGAGWQSLVAAISIGSYYLVGLPVGGLLGYKFKFGVKGIWTGMLAGYVIQLLIVIFVFVRANWQNEAAKAEERVRTWGGFEESQQEVEAKCSMNGDQRT